MKILVVEDNAISRSIMARMLKTIGDCDLAEDGESGIQSVKKEIEKGANYDLIFLDIKLPKVSGKDVLKKIRELENGSDINEKSKIIMTSAVDDSKTIEEMFLDKCDGYLVKPISKNDLMEKLEELGMAVV